MTKRRAAPAETVTMTVDELRAMVTEAAAEGARQALAEIAEAEAEAVESADAKAAAMDRAWVEQVQQMGTVELMPDRDRDVSVNGHTIKLIGGVAQQVPVVYADVYQQALEQERVYQTLEQRLAARGQELERLGG